MKFNIKESVKKEGIPNTFVVELKWMHGDADAFTKTSSKPFKINESEWALEELLLALDTIGELETEDYYDHEAFSKWFNLHEYEFTKEDEALYAPFNCLDVEYDVAKGQGMASLRGYQVYYYDEYLTKCLVEVDYN